MSKLVSLSIGANPTGEATAAQIAAGAAADKVLAQAQTQDTSVVATPTEQLADVVPQALQENVPTGSPEAFARLEEAAGRGEILTQAQEEGVVKPGVFAEASPAQAQEAYIGQLQAEQTRTPEQSFDFEQGVVTLPLSSRANDNVVAKITSDVSKVESAFTGAQAATPKTTPELLPAYNALQRLGLTQEASGRGVTAGSVQPKQGVGAAAYLSFLSALRSLENDREQGKLTGKDQPKGGLSADQAAEGTQGPTEDQYTNRFAFVERIADSFEKMVAQPTNLNPQTGESQGLGFRSQLSKEERLSLGNMIAQTMTEAGLMTGEDTTADSPEYVHEHSIGTGAGKAYEYGVTAQGWKQLQAVAPALAQMIPTLARNVSQTPLPNGGFVGEAALGQQRITRTPLPGKPSKTMLDAMDVMGTMPNMISDHKSKMVEMMLTDIDQRKQQIKDQAKQAVNWDERKAQLPPAAERSPQDQEAYGALIQEYIKAHDELSAQLESPFAILFGQDLETVQDIAEASEIGSRKAKKAYWDGEKWMGKTKGGEDYAMSKSMSDQLDAAFPDKETDVIVEAELQALTRSPQQGGQFHRPFAEEVVQSEWGKAQQTLADAMEQKNKGVFYHGVTAIGNSSRLMITSTQLNYQANKLARFMTDNPRPSTLTKGGAKDKKFRYLVARAMMADADTFTPDQLLKRFNNQQTQDVIAPIARKLYQATESGNVQALGEAIKEAQAAEAVIAAEWEGNGEWGFPVDALHEWGKYLAAPEGSQVSTRLKAEVDGINNGSSIQGLQFGDEGIMKRAGILYDPEGESVIPEGNMRGYIYNQMIQPDDNAGLVGLIDVPKKHITKLGGDDAAASLLKSVADKDLVKKLVKIPLMTTIYGKPYDMHGDHARKFVNANWRKLGLKQDQIKAASAMFTKVIANGLDRGLNTALTHQKVIKYTSGWMFNMMDEIPQIVGPNGYVVQAGGRRYLGETGGDDRLLVTMNTLNEEGKKAGKKRPSYIGVTKTEPSATAAKKGGAIGSITRNQLAVNGTHNIDATIAQLTLIRAKKQAGPKFWGQQVFDAFIGDLDSLEMLLDIGNKTFHQVNSTYNMLEAEYDAYKESRSRFNATVAEAQANNETWDIGEEGKYRGIYQFLKSKLKDDIAWDDADKAHTFYGQFGIQVDEDGMSMDNTVFTPKQVKAMVDYAEENFHGPLGKNVNDSFRDSIRETNARRKEFRKKLLRMRKFIRQFN